MNHSRKSLTTYLNVEERIVKYVLNKNRTIYDPAAFIFIAYRVKINFSKKPAHSWIEDIFEELKVFGFKRKIGRKARNLKKYKCPKSLRKPVMSVITYLYIKKLFVRKT